METGPSIDFRKIKIIYTSDGTVTQIQMCPVFLRNLSAIQRYFRRRNVDKYQGTIEAVVFMRRSFFEEGEDCPIGWKMRSTPILPVERKTLTEHY